MRELTIIPVGRYFVMYTLKKIIFVIKVTGRDARIAASLAIYTIEDFATKEEILARVDELRKVLEVPFYIEYNITNLD